jgi:hypothetical protein
MPLIYRFIFLFFVFQTHFSQEKINGLSFVASNSIPNSNEVLYVKNVAANWVALMPFAFLKSESDTVLLYNSRNQWIGERVEGIEKTCKLFKTNHVKVMMKPQIWIPNGGFTGAINFKTEAQWRAFEKTYEKFIFMYVDVAIKNDIELFCIGTELKFFAQKRSSFFINLIQKIKKVYKGKVTYAENWDCYDQISFWNTLDFIGIDAYFELENSKTATASNLIKKWEPIKIKIRALSKKYNKPILFTEYGYQSKDFTTLKPYDFFEKSTVNMLAQSNALEALLKVFWKEKWFAGGFNWKWYDTYKNSGGVNNSDYTVQNKPAERILKKYYKK